MYFLLVFSLATCPISLGYVQGTRGSAACISPRGQKAEREAGKKTFILMSENGISIPLFFLLSELPFSVLPRGSFAWSAFDLHAQTHATDGTRRELRRPGCPPCLPWPVGERRRRLPPSPSFLSLPLSRRLCRRRLILALKPPDCLSSSFPRSGLKVTRL